MMFSAPCRPSGASFATPHDAFLARNPAYRSFTLATEHTGNTVAPFLANRIQRLPNRRSGMIRREPPMSSQDMTPNTEEAILGRLMQASRRSVSRDVADYLLSMEFDAHDTERMNALAERAREGNLYEGGTGGTR
jgi:hypothetical protein